MQGAQLMWSIGEMEQSNAVTNSDAPTRKLTVSPPYDLAKTVAPAWWARGRWPNVDDRSGAFFWVGWDAGQVAWRSVQQIDAEILEMSGLRNTDLDDQWAAAV